MNPVADARAQLPSALQALGLTEYVGQTKPWTQRGKIRPVVREGSL